MRVALDDVVDVRSSQFVHVITDDGMPISTLIRSVSAVCPCEVPLFFVYRSAVYCLFMSICMNPYYRRPITFNRRIVQLPVEKVITILLLIYATY